MQSCFLVTFLYECVRVSPRQHETRPESEGKEARTVVPDRDHCTRPASCAKPDAPDAPGDSNGNESARNGMHLDLPLRANTLHRTFDAGGETNSAAASAFSQLVQRARTICQPFPRLMLYQRPFPLISQWGTQQSANFRTDVSASHTACPSCPATQVRISETWRLKNTKGGVVESYGLV